MAFLIQADFHPHRLGKWNPVSGLSEFPQSTGQRYSFRMASRRRSRPGSPSCRSKREPEADRGRHPCRSLSHQRGAGRGLRNPPDHSVRWAPNRVQDIQPLWLRARACNDVRKGAFRLMRCPSRNAVFLRTPVVCAPRGSRTEGAHYIHPGQRHLSHRVGTGELSQ